jgi:hypothetical protein
MSGPLFKYNPGGGTCNLGQNHKNLGERGPIGPTGKTGKDGRDGRDGQDGLTGPTGPAGFRGVQGLPGSYGPPGPTGAQGLKGETGLQGPAGSLQILRGTVFLGGMTGLSELPSAYGESGSSGASGATGSIGATGYPGVLLKSTTLNLTSSSYVWANAYVTIVRNTPDVVSTYININGYTGNTSVSTLITEGTNTIGTQFRSPRLPVGEVKIDLYAYSQTLGALIDNSSLFAIGNLS